MQLHVRLHLSSRIGFILTPLRNCSLAARLASVGFYEMFRLPNLQAIIESLFSL